MPVGSLLPRVLEPEVMDSAQEALDYDAMDHREVNEVFAVNFLVVAEQQRIANTAEVLDLGTGTAQIPIELCRRHAGLRIVAIDLAEEMLRLAGRNVDNTPFASRIKLEHVDAKGLPYADGRFGAVISNSIVHHIPEPKAALAEALRVLAPGGIVFVRDLIRPYDEAHLRLLVDKYAGTANEHQRSLFEASLRAALTLDEMRSLVIELGWKANSVVPTSDRHWSWMGVRPT